MSRIKILILTGCLAWAALGGIASAEQYGGVEFPDGARSFADAVVDFFPVIVGGQPTAPHLVATNALGIPDYDGVNSCGTTCSFVSLGDGGGITLWFQDNVLTGSGDGAEDLWIFEVGPDVEDTWVAVSADGVTWHEVGKVYGSTAGIDLDAYGFGPHDEFSYVRLVDDGNEGGQTGITVGADIDAVGAISSRAGCAVVSVDPPPPWDVGQSVTVNGVGFLGGAVPHLGGLEAAPYTVISDTEIQATVPDLPDGEHTLSVWLADEEVWCRLEQQIVGTADRTSWGALKGRYR